MTSSSSHWRVLGFVLIGFSSVAWAANLPLGQTQTGTIATPAQSFSYTFTANAGDVFVFTMGASGNLNPRLRLYDPSGTLLLSVSNYDYIGSNTCSTYDASSVEMTTKKLTTAGTYTLIASDCGDTNTGDYGVFAQRTNNPGSAASLIFGGQTQTNTIASLGQSNTYAFSGTANDTVDLTMTTTKGSLNPKIRLYGSDGTLLMAATNYNYIGSNTCSTYDASSTELKTVKLTATGTHTVLVGDCGDTLTGTYNLSGLCFGVCASSPTTSTLIASPSSLTFSAALGQANPPAQTITVSASGSAVNYTVAAATASGGNWLSATPSSGATPGTISVTVNIGSLSAGTYAGTLAITAAGVSDSPLTVPVTLVIAAPLVPVLTSLSPNSATDGSSVNVALTGTGFVSGAMIKVSNSGVTVSNVSVVSATQISATFAIAANATPGAAGVTVTTPGGTSSAVNFTIVPQPTATTLASSPNPSIFGQNVTLTATVSPAGAMGSVTFMDGSATLGMGTLNGGSATLSLTTLSVGGHTLTAVYNGDANHAGSASAALAQLVNGTTSTTLATSANPSAFGQAVTLTATVTPSAATGTVILTDGSTILGTASLSGGTATLSLTTLSVGTHALTAVYGGDTNYLGSTSAPLTQVTVAASPMGTLLATPTSLSFNYEQGAPALPTQSLTVSSTNGTQLPFTVTPGGGLLLTPGVNGGIAPLPFNVVVSPIGLDTGVYTGMLTISSPGVPPVLVSASLTVTPSTASTPPQLTVSASALDLSGLQGGALASGQIQVSNAGGGVLNFTAAASGGDWLSVSPTFGAIDNRATATSAPVALTITGDPTSLNPGTYQGIVSVSGAGTTVSIPVTFSVASPDPVILVSQAGLGFTAAQQGGAPLPQQLGILNTGNGTLDWTAVVSTLSGGNWLQLSSTGGTVQQPYLDVSLANVTIDPTVVATLTPGDYYGQIQIADAAGLALNSPQLVTVILTVLPQGVDPGPEVNPSGLIFTGPPGASPAPQSVMIGIRKGVGDQYLSGQIGSGFSFSPPSSAVQPSKPVTLQVTPDFTALAPGVVNRGTIALQFLDGTSRNISLLTVVAPAATANSRLAQQAANSCANPILNLQWRKPSQSPTPYFSVVQGQGQTLELQVVDNCGNLIGPANPKSAAVQATFSNKDADLSLVHVGNGIWTGTWKPVNASSGPVTVSVTAFNSTGSLLQSGQAPPLFGTVLPGNTPLVTAGGVEHAASYVLGAPIAPGTLITLIGANLADAASAAPGAPLPTLWNGAQVFLGTEALPLLYTASGQVNVQVPYDVPLNTQFQVTVQRDNLQSLPEQLVIAEAQPGIFTVNASGSGQGIIYKSDGVTLAQPGTPAAVGETITIYCAGLGTVSPPVPAGIAPPTSPVSTTDNVVAVTIGGLDGQASFGTLVAGQPGLYQVSATVPAGVITGDAVPVVMTVAGQTSPAVTMAVQ